MTTRQEALSFGMTFKDVYQDTPFHDPNWILVRYNTVSYTHLTLPTT